MNNKLTIDFGFPQIWKRKKKKKKCGGMGRRDLKDYSSDSAAVNFDKKHPPTPPTVQVSTRTLYLRPSLEVISGLIIQKQLCCNAHLAMYFDKNLCVGPSIRLNWSSNIYVKHCHEWM